MTRSDDIPALIKRIEEAITSADDDHPELMTSAHRRHVARIDVMADARDALSRLTAPVEGPDDIPALIGKLRAYIEYKRDDGGIGKTYPGGSPDVWEAIVKAVDALARLTAPFRKDLP